MSEPIKTREERLEEARVRSEKAKEIIDRFDQLFKDALALCPAPWSWGDKRRQKKDKSFSATLDRVSIATRSLVCLESEFEYADRDAAERAKNEAKAKEDVERLATANIEESRLRTYAVIWLQAKGKVLGKDFEVDTAVETANTIAFEEEITRLTGGGWYRFDGDDCCEDCNGWDGVSHRCDCGNRRMYWEQDDFHNFEHPSARATAY